MTLTTAELRALAPSWFVSLRADRKSPQTIRAYEAGVRLWLDWCEEHDADTLDRARLREYVAGLLDDGARPATARARLLAVRRFVAWLLEEDEIDADPFAGITPPKLDSPIVEPLTEDELRAMLKTCAPPPGLDRPAQMRHRRDEAILRLMLETGMRAGECADLALADVDNLAGTVVVRRGKGGKGRVVSYGPQTARALDRYLRLRRLHSLAATSPALWLGDRGKRFNYEGLAKTLKRRADAAGVVGFHPHKLRHTAAHRWLAAGGSESGLMAVAGWSKPDMLMRYTRAQASSRAAEEARRLNLGDL